MTLKHARATTKGSPPLDISLNKAISGTRTTPSGAKFPTRIILDYNHSNLGVRILL